MRPRWYGLLLLGFACFACTSNPYKQGERLYEKHCSNCHMPNGEGLRALYPPIDVPEYAAHYAGSLACIIRYGLTDTIVIQGMTYVFPMPAMPELNDVEISNIYNFIRYRWHPDLPEINAIAVRDLLERCP